MKSLLSLKMLVSLCVFCSLALLASGAEEECDSQAKDDAVVNRPVSSVTVWIVDQIHQLCNDWTLSPKIETEKPKCGFIPGSPDLSEGEAPDDPDVPGDSEGEQPDGPDNSEGESPDVPGDSEGEQPDGPDNSEGESPDVPGGWEGEDLQEVVLREMISIAAGCFEMGCPESEDGYNNEKPLHTVCLDGYQIGMYELTNEEFVDVLNWAHSRGLLSNADGTPYTNNAIYAYGQVIANTESSSSESQIVFSNGVFSARSREGYKGQMFSMADHPVVHVSWYGAVCYCNWLSRTQGLEPCYNTSTWERYEPVRNGYRLPTEAEWERAAAWDGEKHWKYGISSDDISTSSINYVYSAEHFGNGNPLYLMTHPPTSPVGWYNGINPIRLKEPEKLTHPGKSPVGAYDMSGNVKEWCHDWYHFDYYTESPSSNPTGPQEKMIYRVVRGGSYHQAATGQRTARRDIAQPESLYRSTGFRLARTL